MGNRIDVTMSYWMIIYKAFYDLDNIFELFKPF